VNAARPEQIASGNSQRRPTEPDYSLRE